MTGIVGILQTQACLNAPLFVLPVEIEIRGVDILTIQEVIGLGGVHFAGAMNNIIIIGHVVCVDIAGFQTGLDLHVLADWMCIVRLECINIDRSGQVAGENSLAAIVVAGIGSDVIEILVAAGRIANIIHIGRQLSSCRIILMTVVEID